MSTRHQMMLAAQALFLQKIYPTTGVSLKTVIDRLNKDFDKMPQIDFAYWARATIVEMVVFLQSTNLIKLRLKPESNLEDVSSWHLIGISFSDRTERFISTVIEKAPDQVKLLGLAYIGNTSYTTTEPEPA